MHLIWKLGRLAAHPSSNLALTERVPEFDVDVIHGAFLGHIFENKGPCAANICILAFVEHVECWALINATAEHQQVFL